MTRSIFERYGGFASVHKIVMDFYEKMLESPVTAPYLKNTQMKKLIDHQTKFVSSMMGGPASFTDDHLERVHANLGITNAAFGEAVEMLKESLEDHDVEDEDIDIVEGEVMSRKKIIVTKP